MPRKNAKFIALGVAFIGAATAIFAATQIGGEASKLAPKTPTPTSNASARLTPPDTPIFPKSQSINDIDFTQYSRTLGGYTDLTEGQSRIVAIDVVRLLFAPDAGRKIIKTASSTFDLEGGSVMLLSADGLDGDSVRAQEFYLVFEGEAGAQKLADFGARIKCWRGENTTEWQAELCP